jgi:MoaA/NifB/PqqE/SkfB family radical SAM enzyme
MVVELQDIRQEQGHCYVAPGAFDQRLHFCRLFEDDRPLGPVVELPSAPAGRRRRALLHLGNGDGIAMYFSTSDNTDPRTNGRTYTLRSGGQARPQKSLEPQPLSKPAVTPGTAVDQQVCAEPWQNMIINIDGNVSPCCFWANYQNSGLPLGNTNDQSLEEIWNGEGYRRLRWQIVHGNEPGFPCYECMAYKMGGNRYPPPLAKPHLVEDSLSGSNYHLNRREYDNRAVELQSKPVKITFVSTAKCNITCTFCNQYTQRVEGLAPRRATKEEVLALMPYLAVLNWQGGECFLDPYFMKFLRTFNPGDNPNLRLGIPTNGMLAGAEVAECMEKFNGLGIVFSIDSFTPETYEKLRVGAKFDQVMGNLRRLTEVCRKGPDRSVRVQSCIMKSNFLELTHMLDYAVREGLNVSFSPVLVWPPNEIINVFANFAEESKGWEQELTRAQDFIDAEIARGNQTFASASLYNPRDTIHEVADIFRQAKRDTPIPIK